MRRGDTSDVLYQIIFESDRARDEDESECASSARDGVSSDMTVAQVLRRYPDCRAVFKRHGLNCCACVNSQVETVASISRVLNASLAELLQELNIAARTRAPNTARLPD